MDNLHHVLKDIYYMTNRMKFSAEYVESISPAERAVYIRYFVEDEKKKKERQQNTGKTHGPTIGSTSE